MDKDVQGGLADDPRLIVGVGASAGGLEALEQLFSAIPGETGLAFVVIQHLSPDFKSMMDELLRRRTSLPVVLVEDGVKVERDRIFLIPPKKEMIISGGRLFLTDKGASAERTLPIDIFFRSLAEDVGQRAVGVVLSGGGTDGSRGIRDIHEAGGLVICQDEDSAAFDGMPRSARETGTADHVASPEEIAVILVDYAERLAIGADAAGPSSIAALPPRGVASVFALLERGCGIDFAAYKPSTVSRRLDRRMQLTGSKSLDDYAGKLAMDRKELDALYRDLLIGVTRFFRDDGAFELLEHKVLPHLLQHVGIHEEVRVWVPGCATGEEAYSIGILLHEAFERLGQRRRMKIFATDVHADSLEFAGRGLYSGESLSRVSPARLAQYFEKHGEGYQVTSELRQQIVFARHNVMRDAPFTRVDLISCRNLLIYLQAVAQRRVLGLFHFALKHQGVLFLGPSENAASLADDFDAVDTHWRIYRKQRDHRQRWHDRVSSSPTRSRGSLPGLSTPTGAPYPLSETIGIYDALLDELMPASLLLNEKRELVHAFGGAGRFMRMRDGRASLNVLDMVEPDLKVALAGALQRASKEATAVVFKGLRMAIDGEESTWRLTVRPVVAKRGGPRISSSRSSRPIRRRRPRTRPRSA